MATDSLKKGEGVMTAEATSFETKDRAWWLLLIEGIAAVIIGAILLLAPAKTAANFYQILVQLLGIYWIISGVLLLVNMFMDHTAWGWKLFMGIVSIIAGGYILMYPIAAAVALPRIFVLVLGIWGLMQGILYLVLAFKGGGWGMGILGGLLILLGIYLVANWGVVGMGLAMVWAVAVTAVIGGIILIFQAFRQRAI
jgi:uncharacterized membrane protein HdeD (DUF308 family)